METRKQNKNTERYKTIDTEIKRIGKGSKKDGGTKDVVRLRS